VREEEPAGLGQRHRARAAGALDEAVADRAFERRDLLADGRLGVAERVRRAAERPFLCERLQRGQMAELDAEPTISFHNGDEL
jgi:hypothetical protein